MGCLLFLGGRLQACVSLYFGRGVYLMCVGVPNKKSRKFRCIFLSIFYLFSETDKSESAGSHS